MSELVHVIDFEGSLRTGIVEVGIASIVFSNAIRKPFEASIVDTQTWLCKPHTPITPQETQVHGLKYNELLDQKPFSEYYEEFRLLRNTGVFAAHSVQVERNLITQYWPVSPARKGEWASTKYSSQWGPWIDSLEIAREFHSAKSLSLGSLIDHEDIGLRITLDKVAKQFCPEKRRKSHCALYDALASAALLLEFYTAYGLSVAEMIRLSQPNNAFKQGDSAQPDLL